MLAAALDRVLRTLSPEEKLTYLRHLSPADAQAIEVLINYSIETRWPTTPTEWFQIADRLPRPH